MCTEGTFRLAVLLSGSGTNLQAIIDTFKGFSLPVEIAFVASNKRTAGGLERARKHNIPAFHISKKLLGSQQKAEEEIFRLLKEYNVDLLCLAGYLKKLTSWIVNKFQGKIINIHPGILPFMGGKGLYGQHVHQKVIDLGMKVTGVTIHFVDDEYDHGPIIAQQCVPVKDNDTAATLAERVLKVEHSLYPQIIGYFAKKCVQMKAGKVYINDEKRG